MTLLILCSPFIFFWIAPAVIFSANEPGYDRNWEHIDGKAVAWGPKPRAWLLMAEPDRVMFSGNEWYYKTWGYYCRDWLKRNNMVRPPQ
jgi:hypothetical protein